MVKREIFDAAVIGSGPNGFAAAIALAQAGFSVVIYEAKEVLGGGMRSGQLTLPGFIHDICSAIHPLGARSPFFLNLPLEDHGLEWIYPPVSLAHPLDNEPPILLEGSISKTCTHLDDFDRKAYQRLLHPFVKNWDLLAEDILAPLHFPKYPLLLSEFAYFGMQSAKHLINSHFKGKRAQSFFAGLSAHSILPLNNSLTAAFGLILGTLGHAIGWPLAKNGSQKIADALASFFCSLGGTIRTGIEIQSPDQLSARCILCDLTPRQMLSIFGKKFPACYKKRLESYRYGPGVFKLDWALSHPIPWKEKDILQAGSVHLGGSAEEIITSEKEVWEGKHPEKPFVILAQQSLFDKSRAPQGNHTAWGYCHVPNGSTLDMTERIEGQIERFAPGFKDCILMRSKKNTHELEQYNRNYVGGDINGGVQDIFQLYTRPVARLNPYSTPVPGLYICSSSTPPGGGVHGMCGYYAAESAIKFLNKKSS